MPQTLPANLIPPSMRKGSQAGTPMSANAVGPATFEDKRKENFDKGAEILVMILCNFTKNEKIKLILKLFVNRKKDVKV